MCSLVVVTNVFFSINNKEGNLFFVPFLFIDECNIVEDERPGVEDKKKINKEGSGMNQMDNAAADLKSANDNDSNADQAKVTATGRSFKAAEIPIKVKRRICLKLNIEDNYNFKDYRFLGEKMGFNQDEIKNLQRSANPTYDLLNLWSVKREATVEKLIEFLREDDMDRADVAIILEDWLKKEISNT